MISNIKLKDLFTPPVNPISEGGVNIDGARRKPWANSWLAQKLADEKKQIIWNKPKYTPHQSKQELKQKDNFKWVITGEIT